MSFPTSMQFTKKDPFTLDEQQISCQVRCLSPEEIPMILALQQRLYQGIERKETFVTLSEPEWSYLMQHGFVVAIFPPERREPAYLMGCIYPPEEENLGHDIGLSPEELEQVAHLEIAMADPEFRGFGMHSRMCQLCCEELARTDAPTLSCPPSIRDNLPSKRALESAGLVTMVVKEKHAGKRCAASCWCRVRF